MGRREIGLVAGYAISLIGGVLSLVLYAHMLGPADYGRLAVYLALVEALQGVLFQWHRLAVVKFWAVNEKADFASFLKTYHLVWLGLACAVLTVLGLAHFIEGKPLDPEWPAVIAMGIGKSAALYAQEIARASGASLRYAFGALLMTIGSAVAGVVAYRMTHSITAIMLASTAVFISSSVICGCRVGIASTGGRFSRQHVRSMLAYGLPLVPVFLAATALTRLDRPILAQFEVPAVVGAYVSIQACSYGLKAGWVFFRNSVLSTCALSCFADGKARRRHQKRDRGYSCCLGFLGFLSSYSHHCCCIR